MFPFHLLRRPVLAALFLSIAPPGWAQQGLSLQQAQHAAIATSRQLAAQDAAIASVREMSVAAGQLPDPVLKLGIDNLPINGPDRFSLTRDFMTMRRIGLVQELPRAEKRQLKVERFDKDAQRIQAERDLAVATIQRDTALAWTDRYYAQAMLKLLRQQEEAIRLQIEGAEIAYRAGRGNQADIFAARGALANLRDKLRQTERQDSSAALMLARWVGPELAMQPLAGQVEWRDGSIAPVTPVALLGHPQLAALQVQVAATETQVKQAQANTRADWTVEAMYSQRGSGYSNMVSVGVSIPLQLDRPKRQDREVAAKLASLAEAQARLDDALRAHEAEVNVMLNEWTRGKDRAVRLRAELLPAASQRTQAALTTYRTGKSDLASILSARRDEVDAGIQVLVLEMETARLWVQLNYLVAGTGAAAPTKEHS